MRRVLLVLAVPTLILVSGCGACPKVARHREAFVAAQALPPTDERPHLRLGLPQGMVDGWLNRAISQLPVAGFQPPGLGEIGRYATGFDFKAERLSATLSKDDDAKFDLDLAVRRSTQRLFGVEMAANAPVTYDRRTRKMRIALRADMFESIRPKLEGGAVDRLAGSLLSGLPAAARALLPRELVTRLAQQGIDALTRQTYSLVRAKLLTPLGELAHFEVQLPDVPLESVGLRNAPGGWSVQARTSLPGVGLATAPRMAGGADRVKMQISSAVLASLGNWGMANGRLPARYSREGKPDAGGDLLAGVGWQPGAAPLKAHFWSQGAADAGEQGICVYARAAAQPEIRLKDGRLDVSFTGGTVEEVMGPPLINEAARLLGMTERVFEFGRSMAVDTRIKLGKGEQAVELVGATLNGQALDIDLRLGGATAGARSPRSEAPVAPARVPWITSGAQAVALPACGG